MIRQRLLLTENDGTHTSKHEHKSDTPSDIGLCLVISLCEVGNRQADSEEVEGIPTLYPISFPGNVCISRIIYPSHKSYSEERPLHAI